jgi:hypothetical protein
MSVGAAVKKSIEWGMDHHWRLELPEPEQSAFFRVAALAGMEAWLDYYRMECAERHVEIRRLYQNMPVFDI